MCVSVITSELPYFITQCPIQVPPVIRFYFSDRYGRALGLINQPRPCCYSSLYLRYAI